MQLWAPNEEKNKLGMNGHPIGPFCMIIEPVDSPIDSPGFYMLKTIDYWLQERVMNEKLIQKMQKHGPNIFFQGMFFFHPWGPRGPPKKLFNLFSILMIPRGPLGIPGDPGGKKNIV